MIDTKELRRLAQAANASPDGDVMSWIEGMQRLQGALLPDDVIELLDRLEAAEKERDALRAAVRHEADCVGAAKAEIDALRAKIEQMEKQAPVAWTTKLALEYGASTLGFQVSGVNMWGEKGVPLYALPGAQPAPSVPDHKTIRDLLNESGLCAYDREGDLAFMVAATKFAALAAAPAPEAKP